ncbi:MAG: hypothetical protein MI861_23615 [Pirellulales bacterium]|nr:hypothetical protein [Pirellulales bacterium]
MSSVKRPRNLTLIVDPLGNETHFTFTERGQQATRTLPLGFGDDGIFGTADDALASDFTERFEYDDRGRQILHISFEGVVTENVYDEFGRMSGMSFYASESAYENGIISKHDQYGRLHKVTFVDNPTSTDPSTGTIVRTEETVYDNQGRIIAEVSEEGVIGYA